MSDTPRTEAEARVMDAGRALGAAAVLFHAAAGAPGGNRPPSSWRWPGLSGARSDVPDGRQPICIVLYIPVFRPIVGTTAGAVLAARQGLGEAGCRAKSNGGSVTMSMPTRAS